jgi:YYY domain-containing protein
VLASILVVGGFLRLTYINWDTNGERSLHLHPDERFITQISVDTRGPSSPLNYFDTETSALNPYNIERADGSRQGTFVYGTLPIFVNKAVASNLNLLSLGILDNHDNYDHYHLSGRALAGLFDLGTIVFIFLLGMRLANRSVGLLAAGLYAVTPFAIQNAHFFVVDPFLTFLATATVYFAVVAAQSGGWRNFALAGGMAGLAAATKITAVSLLPVIVLAIGVYASRGMGPLVTQIRHTDTGADEVRDAGRTFNAALGTLVLGSLLALGAALVTFRIAMPYAFNTPNFSDLLTWHFGTLYRVPVLYPDILNQHWLQDQANQQRLLGGDSAFPPNVQWIGRTPFLWPLQQMVLWGMAPALGIAAWLGVFFAAAWALTKRQWVWLVPLAWVLGYFGFMGAQYSLYMRYFLPIYPVLAIFAAFLLFELTRWATSSEPLAARGSSGRRLTRLVPALPYVARAATVIVVVATALAGLAFYNIYREPVSRSEASVWMYENIPPGSVIGQEHWDDHLPYGIPGYPSGQYQSVTFENFQRDTPERIEQLLTDIDAVDYISLSSRRLSGVIPRVPAIWPVTSRYYAALESGELGFEKAAEFTSFPRAFGIEIDNTSAEESFTVYDHPQVTIYRKTDEYSPERAREVLIPVKADTAIQMTPGEAGQNALLFQPDVLERQRGGGTWSGIFSPGNVINNHPFIAWLLAMQVAALALVPLAIVAFRALPDRGYLLTKPLGVLALAYLAYAPAAFFGVAYTRGLIAAALLAMVFAGVAAGYAWRAELLAFVRERWRMIAFCESLFVLAFGGAYWLRLQNPDLWHPFTGGEKPMDFAYLNGVIRTTDMTQGPIDPWYSGGYLNYYYYGQFISATWTKLLGIVPEVAYNLLVPMFFALAAAATFSLAYNLAEATRRMLRQRRPGGGAPLGILGPYLAGLGAVFLVLLSGNLRAVEYLHQSMARISPWESGIPVVGLVLAFAGGIREILFGDASLKAVSHGYDWWGPSRALGVREGETVAPISEFPFWTFLFADLHAHLMAIPFAMTAAAIGLALVLNFSRPNAASVTSGRQREIASWAMVIVLALIVGSLRWINSWDYPPFLLLGAAAILLAERAKDGRVTQRAVLMGTVKAAVMVVLTFAFFAPFIRNYDQFYAGFSQSEQTTALGDYFSHFGVMLILMAGFVLVMLARALGRTNGFRALFYGRERRRAAFDMLPVVLALALAGGAIVWAGTMQRWGVTALALVSLVALAVIAYRELRNPSPTAPVLLFVFAMAGLGFGLSGGVEVLTLDGDVGRMNTVFKFYLHVWMLWGVVAAFGLWYVFGVMRPQEAFFRRSGELRGGAVRMARYAFAMAAVAVLLLALVYPAFGTRARIHDRFDPSLGATNDGLAYMDVTVYRNGEPGSGQGGDHDLTHTRDAINWIRQHIDGTPTIIEGVAPSYRSMGSRISIHTGLPAVAAWDWHQRQQRPRFAQTVTQRQQDIEMFYRGTDVGLARDVIQKYDVEWVIVGDVERNHYPADGIAKFEDGLGGMLELAYENPSFWIFHVIPADELRTLATAESGR